MRIREFLQQRFGFTRNEIVVVGLLSAGLLAGTAVRAFRGSGTTRSAFSYVEADSAFVRGARAFHASMSTKQDSGRARPALRPVDLNDATATELVALPGIGPAMAGRILAYRKEHGRFASVDDLDRVRGIGPATLRRLRPLVHVDRRH
jgi:comEA protein